MIKMMINDKNNYMAILMAFSYTTMIILFSNINVDDDIGNNLVSASICYMFQLFLSNVVIVLNQDNIKHISVIVIWFICLTSMITTLVIGIKVQFGFNDIYIIHGLSCLNITLLSPYLILKVPHNRLINNIENLIWFMLSLIMVYYYQQYLISGVLEYFVISYFLLFLPMIILIVYCGIMMLWSIIDMFRYNNEEDTRLINLA